jgi:hypothetical protein
MNISTNVKGRGMGKVASERGTQKLPCEELFPRSRDVHVLRYEELLTSFRKGLRNGNWRRLNPLNTALYRASLWYAKHRGSIVKASLVKKLSALVEKLKETKGMRIFKRGFEKAVVILEKGLFV